MVVALRRKVIQMAKTQAELAQDLRDVLAQQQKTSSEIATLQTSVDALKARIAELETASAGASQELIDAVAAVKAQAQIVDDQIPDAPAPAPEPPTA